MAKISFPISLTYDLPNEGLSDKMIVVKTSLYDILTALGAAAGSTDTQLEVGDPESEAG